MWARPATSISGRPPLNISYYPLPYLCKIAMQKKALLKQADAYARNQFSFLGSRPACYLEMPWHEDVRSGDGFDIKMPWEFARFAYTPILAHAYAHTNNARYLDAFKKQISSFLDAAPFLQGIHWSNPMECAIRATNWIVAYQIIGDELQKDVAFHERSVKSLWQHMLFIENNWELYDGRTNNHYLSNLVGYAYLSWFFNDIVRWNHCWKELCSELEWQLQEDGSSYEGSTAYHGFVTELFVHGFLIADQMGESITPQIRAKIERMLQFADATKDLCIGDDDSGSLLHPGLYELEVLACKLGVNLLSSIAPVMHCKKFGLSLITQDPWKISLRHHAYHGRQPSAHFHEDVGSITLSYNGMLILVDPGSYLYTGSKTWRNYFRSAAQHSTVYPAGWNQKNNDLFALKIPEADAHYEQTDQSIRTLHSFFGYPISREITWNDHEVIIHDHVAHATDQIMWQFLFSPELSLQKNSENGWDIMRGTECILRMRCEQLKFEKRMAWASPAYGVKKKACALFAKGERGLGQVRIQFIRGAL